MDYKALLHFEEKAAEYETQIDDISIIAYLLNPLQSTYDYDSIARDYLGEILPSRKEILEKKDLSLAIEAGDEKGYTVAAYLAKVPYLAAEIVEEKLKESGMDTLYESIERPLVYSLYAMEKYGITCLLYTSPSPRD